MVAERLYNLKRTGELLGGLSAREVRRLIKNDALPAKKRCVRGEGKLPRLFVTASAINDYIRALPDANAADVIGNEGSFKRKSSKLQAELDAVPDRFARSKGHN